MANLRQSAGGDTGGSDPGSATFASTPVEGNLLIAVASERSGTSATNQTISGTGWTKRIEHDGAIADTSHRRTMSVWSKLAGASEPTTITVDDGTANSKWLTVYEYQHDVDEDEFNFLEKAENDNGATIGGTSVSTGTTASVSGTKFLEFGILTGRNDGAPSAHTPTWTNGLVEDLDFGAAGFGMMHVAAADDVDTVAETKESTVSSVRSENSGLTAGILVFSLEAGAGGGGSIAPLAMHHRKVLAA